MPNGSSPYQTTATIYIDNYYATLMLRERWTWERYTRLCRFLKYTPYELGSMVLLRHKAVNSYQTANILRPREMAQALLLTILEAHVYGNMYHDVIANPFPKVP